MGRAVAGTAFSRDTKAQMNPSVNDTTIKRQLENGGLSWGRKTESTRLTTIISAFMILWCPVWVTLNWMCLEHFDGSVTLLFKALWESNGAISFVLSHLPRPSWTGVAAYTTWLLFQAVLYYFLPGKMCFGQLTPGGYKHKYDVNGVMAWTITHLLFVAAVLQGWLDPACIAKNWAGLFVAASVYGYLLAAVMYAKGHFWPTHVEDRKFSGSWTHDFWMGLELNPRFGKSFDIKLFHNGRPGIVAWTLIDLSFAAWQYEKYGVVTNSMIIVIILHTIYVMDFFFNEEWYLKTMDITHDHFGMMLAWGDAVFLPAFYTIQAQYLAIHPIQLSTPAFAALLVLGLAAYVVFRASNSEKIHVRDMRGQAEVWGKPATVLECTYRTSDGIQHRSALLTCGWWAVARHANYTADLLLAWTMCAATSGDGLALLPWTYFLFQFVLLNHRIIRGEQSCRTKYGQQWDEYCRIVPYKLIPWIY